MSNAADPPPAYSRGVAPMSERFKLLGEGGEEEVVPISVPITTLKLVKNTVGVGIIAMPYCLRLAGFGVGVLLMIILAAIIDYSLVLLVRAGRLASKTTLPGVMDAAFGKTTYVIVAIFLFLYLIASLGCINVVIGSTVTKLLLGLGAGDACPVLGNRIFVIFLVTVLLTFPLSLIKNSTCLEKWSVFALGFVVVVVVLVTVRLATLEISPTEDAFNIVGLHVSGSVAVITVGFLGHHTALGIHDSMADGTERRWGLVTHTGVMGTLCVYLVFCLIGYATFTGNCEDNLLENYCSTDAVMNAGRFLFAIFSILAFPVTCTRAKQILDEDLLPNHFMGSKLRHAAITTIIVLCSFVVSMTTDCLGMLLEYTGILCGTPLVYIFPPIAVMKLQNDSWMTLWNIPLLTMAAGGIVYILVAIVMSGSQLFVELPLCNHGAEPAFCGQLANQTTLVP